MIEPHLLKLRARDRISAGEEAVIRAGVREVVRIPADRIVVRARQALDTSTILLSGIAARQKVMRDGKRQITELHVAGDFIDLHGFTLKYLEHDIATLTECTFAAVPHAHLEQMTERHPRLTRIYWFGTNLDAAIHREWEMSLGSRSAIARMAHLFCELCARLDIVGLVQGNSYRLPISQQELSEMLGITPVHANRTLQQLRKQGLMEFARGIVTINDLIALKRVGEFDAAYLYLDRHSPAQDAR